MRVEEATGLDFFSSLPQEKQRKLEMHSNPNDWSWRDARRVDDDVALPLPHEVRLVGWPVGLTAAEGIWYNGAQMKRLPIFSAVAFALSASGVSLPPPAFADLETVTNVPFAVQPDSAGRREVSVA